MTLKEVFEKGGRRVGNLIILEGGQHFLIGDATPAHGPHQDITKNGWDGWLGQNVLYVLDLLDERSCAILEAFKAKCSLEREFIRKELRDATTSSS